MLKSDFLEMLLCLGLERDGAIAGSQRDESVQGATVQQMPAESLGEQAGDRALAGTAWTIDGHNRYRIGRGISHSGRP